MIAKWFDENVTTADVLIIAVLLAGLVAAFLGLGEFLGAAIGSATTYVVKDKSKQTQANEERTKRLETELAKERRLHDDFIKKAKEIAETDASDTPLDDLVASANARISRSKDR
jgi:hypothetical protein